MRTLRDPQVKIRRGFFCRIPYLFIDANVPDYDGILNTDDGFGKLKFNIVDDEILLNTKPKFPDLDSVEKNLANLEFPKMEEGILGKDIIDDLTEIHKRLTIVDTLLSMAPPAPPCKSIIPQHNQ